MHAALFVLTAVLSAASSSPGEVFTRSPAALLAEAAEGERPSGTAVEVLEDTTEISIDASHRERWRTVLVYRVLDLAGLPAELREVSQAYGWRTSRPEIRARVTGPDGRVHWLDPSLLVEVGVQEDTDVYSEERRLRAPLPALAEGAVVEVETRWEQTPWLRAGANHRLGLKNRHPTRALHVRVEVPRRFPWHAVVRGADWPVHTRERGDRRIVTVDVPPTPGDPDVEPGTPEEYPPTPVLWFLTVGAWSDVAHEYSDVVDGQLAAVDLRSLAREVVGDAPDAHAAVNRIVTWMHRRSLRYASVNLGDTSVVPRARRSRC